MKEEDSLFISLCHLHCWEVGVAGYVWWSELWSPYDAMHLTITDLWRFDLPSAAYRRVTNLLA